MREEPMRTRTFGRQGLVVSEIGPGCMSMTGIYGTPDEEEALATIDRALDLGVNFLETLLRRRVGAMAELAVGFSRAPSGHQRTSRRTSAPPKSS